MKMSYIYVPWYVFAEYWYGMNISTRPKLMNLKETIFCLSSLMEECSLACTEEN